MQNWLVISPVPQAKNLPLSRYKYNSVLCSSYMYMYILLCVCVCAMCAVGYSSNS